MFGLDRHGCDCWVWNSSTFEPGLLALASISAAQLTIVVQCTAQQDVCAVMQPQVMLLFAAAGCHLSCSEWQTQLADRRNGGLLVRHHAGCYVFDVLTRPLPSTCSLHCLALCTHNLISSLPTVWQRQVFSFTLKMGALEVFLRQRFYFGQTCQGMTAHLTTLAPRMAKPFLPAQHDLRSLHTRLEHAELSEQRMTMLSMCVTACSYGSTCSSSAHLQCDMSIDTLFGAF